MATTRSHSAAASRDDQDFHYDLSNAIYGSFPMSPHRRRSRATSPSAALNPNPNPNISTRCMPIPTTTANQIRPSAPPTWLLQPKQRNSLARQQGMSIHQSTCLNLNMAASGESSESDLWILPELDDWEEGEETETESSQGTLSPSASQSSTAPEPTAEGGTREGQNKWAGVFRRAANSNLERLRTRLEGDGWDFVGGRYGDETKNLGNEGREGEESLDEEFDVVVLSRGRGCR
ncbi:hypothetical protein G6011_06768 [Alternaria panax]|uniref:Uncharacterized protein n=1 Tax=Alternaria panax TaxID=48097 RepID=A0AAD4I5S3_9PLEO|nr:hypothetical protein G6011_06768 [Alternaria panax]